MAWMVLESLVEQNWAWKGKRKEKKFRAGGFAAQGVWMWSLICRDKMDVFDTDAKKKPESLDLA